MPSPKTAIGQDRDNWRVGQRVTRRDTEEQGTIAAANGQIKVKWDGGRTSYYDRITPANVQLSQSKL
jgi:hypothetical protein